MRHFKTRSVGKRHRRLCRWRRWRLEALCLGVLLCTARALVKLIFVIPETACPRPSTWRRRRHIYIVCDSRDWSCASGFLQRFADALSEFNIDYIYDSACFQENVHPRIFVSGGQYENWLIGQTDTLREYHEASDLRVLFNFEPRPLAMTYSGDDLQYDFAFTTVRSFTTGARGVYIPYIFFAHMQVDKSMSRTGITRDARVTHGKSKMPGLFGIYANSHCRSQHRVNFYNFVAQNYKPLQFLNKKCGSFDERAALGLADDRKDQSSFLTSVISHFSEYKFAVVFESADLPGYMTEKLLIAKSSGAVPVYFGNTRFLSSMLNRRSFIDCTSENMETEKEAFARCLKTIILLDTNESLWLGARGEPLFNVPTTVLNRQLAARIGDIFEFLTFHREENPCEVMLRASIAFGIPGLRYPKCSPAF